MNLIQRRYMTYSSNTTFYYLTHIPGALSCLAQPHRFFVQNSQRGQVLVAGRQSTLDAVPEWNEVVTNSVLWHSRPMWSLPECQVATRNNDLDNNEVRDCEIMFTRELPAYFNVIWRFDHGWNMQSIKALLALLVGWKISFTILWSQTVKHRNRILTFSRVNITLIKETPGYGNKGIS